MRLTLAAQALEQQHIAPRDVLIAVERVHMQRFSILGDLKYTLYAQRADLFNVDLTSAAHAHHMHLFGIHAVLRAKLVVGIGIAGLQESQHGALLLRFGDQHFAQVCAAEAVVAQRVDACGVQHSRNAIPAVFALLPCKNAIRPAAFQILARFFNHQALHLKSPSFLFSPSSVIVLAKSFIVAANFAPSAAETHSTRVRRLSMPR